MRQCDGDTEDYARFSLSPRFVRLRSAIADILAAPVRLFAPLSRRLSMFYYEIRARSAICGTIEPGTQFFGKVTVLGTGKVHIGMGTRLGRNAYLETGEKGVITIGRNCVISDGATIVSYDEIRIGACVMMGEYSSIRDANHGTKLGEKMRWQPHTSSRILIEDDVWIGRGACVLQGVCIGSGAIIGANSVVTRDIDSQAIAVGAPARAIGARTEPVAVDDGKQA